MAGMANDQAWKAFDTSSEAGRLLRQIYGAKGPPVNVPLPRKSKSSKLPTEGWRPVSNKPGQVDPRTATRSINKERQLDVPLPNAYQASGGKKFAAIDFVERKRSNLVIGEEIADLKMRTAAYRPAHVRPQGEEEKVRLGEICAFKGGKALPTELTAVPMDVLPSEQLRRAKEADRLDKVRRRRAGLPEYDDAPRQSKASLGMSAMAEQLVGEIEERRAHLAEMEHLGMKTGNERVIAGEIKARLTELRRIDPKAASSYVGNDEAVVEPSFTATRISAPFHRD